MIESITIAETVKFWGIFLNSNQQIGGVAPWIKNPKSSHKGFSGNRFAGAHSEPSGRAETARKIPLSGAPNRPTSGIRLGVVVVFFGYAVTSLSVEYLVALPPAKLLLTPFITPETGPDSL